MPPAIPNTADMNDENRMVTPRSAIEARLRLMRGSRRPRQRAIDHVDGVFQPIHRDKRAEARPLFLAEQHLVEHVEPIERHAGPTVLGFLRMIEKRLAAADFINDV